MLVGGLIARMGVGESIPVVGKDLLEDVPVPCGCCQHEGPPSSESDKVAIPLLYHSSFALSIPPRCAREHPHPPHCPWCYEDFWGLSTGNAPWGQRRRG